MRWPGANQQFHQQPGLTNDAQTHTTLHILGGPLLASSVSHYPKFSALEVAVNNNHQTVGHDIITNFNVNCKTGDLEELSLDC